MRFLLAAAYLKAFKAFQRGGILRLDALYNGKLRSSFRHIVHKALKLRTLALQLQLHAGGGVLYIPGETVAAHQLVNERAEAHALHDAVYPEMYSFQWGSPL